MQQLGRRAAAPCSFGFINIILFELCLGKRLGESFGKVLLAQKVMDCITCRGNSSPFALLAVAEAVVVVVVAVVVVVVVAALVVVARGLGAFSPLGFCCCLQSSNE